MFLHVPEEIHERGVLDKRPGCQQVSYTSRPAGLQQLQRNENSQELSHTQWLRIQGIFLRRTQSYTRDLKICCG